MIPPSVTVTGELSWDGHGGSAPGQDAIVVQLPGVAPVPLESANVNFSDNPAGAADADATCRPRWHHRPRPPGKVCIYRVAPVGSSCRHSAR